VSAAHPPGIGSACPSAHRPYRYRLVAEPAQRAAILGRLHPVDRRAAVRAALRHNPGRTGSGTLPSRRLPFRLLLALNVIVQRALLQRRHVYDDLAPVRGVAADGHPLADRKGKLDLGYPVRVAELLSPSYLREAPRLRTAGAGWYRLASSSLNSTVWPSLNLTERRTCDIRRLAAEVPLWTTIPWKAAP
jgi:hypothetical protein